MGALRGAVGVKPARAAWLACALAVLPPAAAVPRADAPRDAADELAARLRAEIDGLGDPGEDPAAAARIAYRRIAFDLLHRHGAPGAGPQCAAMSGFRLAWLRDEVDAALAAPPAGAEASGRFRAAVAQFASAASHGMEGAVDPSDPGAALAPMLAPLESALAAAAGVEVPAPGACWPFDAATGSAGSADAAAERAATGPASPAIPADDAGRAAAIDGWVGLVSGCDDRAGRRFARTADRWRAALAGAPRAGDARANMDALAAEAPMARPGPFERALRKDEPAAREACAGRGPDLLRHLDRARAAWATAWSDGAGSPEASRALLRTLRVLDALDAAAAPRPSPDAVRRLSSWGGLAVPAAGWPDGGAAAKARAALAMEALLAGDPGSADRTLLAAEEDLAIVAIVAEPARRIAAALPAGTGLSARLAAVRDTPRAGAFLAAERGRLANVSRLMAEAGRARDAGPPGRADEARSAAAQEASAALRSAGIRPVRAALDAVARSIDAREAAVGGTRGR